MQISTTPYVFSYTQTHNLEKAGINLELLKDESQLLLAYEKHLNVQRAQLQHKIAIVVSNVAMMVFTILDFKALVCVSIGYIGLFSYIYYENKKKISSEMELVKKLGESYSELSNVSARDATALAIEAHIRKKIHVAMQQLKNFRMKNTETKHFEINQILLN
jgi:hypothetical protein